MADALCILIATDAERKPDGPAIPHIYATQIEYLRRAGNKVHLFGVDDRTSPRGILRNIRELRREAARLHPDLLVTYYGSMVAAISRIGAGRIPLVAAFRGSDLLGTSNPGWVWRLRDRLARLLSLWAAARARQIIVNGSGLRLALPERLRPKAHNLPNGIDVALFCPAPRGDARHQLGWPPGEPVILFNAGIDSGQVVKNLPLAEAVVQQLQASLPGVRLEKISSLSREAVALRMNASDCLLMTSLHEGSPDLVKEAMACNLPVVSVPCGDVAERLAGVEPGGVAPYEAGALAQLVEPILRERRRSNGREQLFQQGLDIPSVTRRVLEVYQAAAGK